MHRILISPKAIEHDTITITDPKTLHHLHDVLRVKAGERLECFDGHGSRSIGIITQSGRQKLIVNVEQRTQEPLPLLHITLAQALIKPSHFEWAIQKATELGVSTIVPLVTARTTVRSSGRAEHRLIRWRRIVEEAATQCGLAHVPLVTSPHSFEPFVNELDGRLVFLPTLVGNAPDFSQQLGNLRPGIDVIVLIGREGDSAPEEVQLATRHGARPVRLGRLTLRAETAALVTLALLQHAV